MIPTFTSTTPAATKGFLVRRATADDAPALAAMRSALFAELGRDPTGEPGFNERSADALSDGITKGWCVAWIAESAAGTPIGSTALMVFPRLPSPESFATREGYLLNVYTEPSWRRRGVSAALVAASVDEARAEHLSRIRLHATAAGRSVYLGAGFTSRDDEMELRLSD